MSFCSQCGTKISAGDRFCPECGHPQENPHEGGSPPPPALPSATSAPPLAVPAKPVPPAAALPGPPKKKLSGCAIAGIVGGSVLALFAAIIVVIVIVVLSASSGAVEATRDHLTHLKNGDLEGAYAGTSGGFQSVTSLEQYRSFVSANPALADVVSSSFDERSVENGVANIGGTITDSSGTERPFRAQLVKENGEWKILGIDLTGGGGSASSRIRPGESAETRA